MSAITAAAFALVLSSILGCSEPAVTLPRELGFDELRGVELGMTAGQLRRLRPVSQVPYGGLTDSNHPKTWYFHFDENTLSETARLPDHARLISVERVYRVASGTVVSQYESAVANLTAKLREPKCSNRIASLWVRSGFEIGVDYTSVAYSVHISRKTIGRSRIASQACRNTRNQH